MQGYHIGHLMERKHFTNSPPLPCPPPCLPSHPSSHSPHRLPDLAPPLAPLAGPPKGLTQRASPATGALSTAAGGFGPVRRSDPRKQGKDIRRDIGGQHFMTWGWSWINLKSRKKQETRSEISKRGMQHLT